MNTRKPLWDILSEVQKKKCIDTIIGYFEDERDEVIGVVAAEELFDIIMQSSFTDIYNKGIVDAHTLVQEKNADLSVDLDLLLKK